MRYKYLVIFSFLVLLAFLYYYRGRIVLYFDPNFFGDDFGRVPVKKTPITPSVTEKPVKTEEQSYDYIVTVSDNDKTIFEVPGHYFYYDKAPILRYKNLLIGQGESANSVEIYNLDTKIRKAIYTVDNKEDEIKVVTGMVVIKDKLLVTSSEYLNTNPPVLINLYEPFSVSKLNNTKANFIEQLNGEVYLTDSVADAMFSHSTWYRLNDDLKTLKKIFEDNGGSSDGPEFIAALKDGRFLMADHSDFNMDTYTPFYSKIYYLNHSGQEESVVLDSKTIPKFSRSVEYVEESNVLLIPAEDGVYQFDLATKNLRSVLTYDPNLQVNKQYDVIKNNDEDYCITFRSYSTDESQGSKLKTYIYDINSGTALESDKCNLRNELSGGWIDKEISKAVDKLTKSLNLPTGYKISAQKHYY